MTPEEKNRVLQSKLLRQAAWMHAGICMLVVLIVVVATSALHLDVGHALLCVIAYCELVRGGIGGR